MTSGGGGGEPVYMPVVVVMVYRTGAWQGWVVLWYLSVPTGQSESQDHDNH